MRALAFSTLLALSTVVAEEPPNATELAGRLADAVRDGTSTARLKMEFPSAAEKTVLQIRANARRTEAGTDLHYQVLWPKDRPQGSFVLAKPTGKAPTGSVLQPDGSVKPIASPQDSVLGSHLAYEDLAGNYFAWEKQRITGQESVNRIPCVILESQPGPGDQTAYGSVRTWVDVKRLVPLRVEKLNPAGQVVRRITIDRVTRDDTNRTVPAAYIIERPGQPGSTLIEGSNIKHGVELTDADFSPEVLHPKSAAP
jgi:hypothetical protein